MRPICKHRAFSSAGVQVREQDRVHGFNQGRVRSGRVRSTGGGSAQPGAGPLVRCDQNIPGSRLVRSDQNIPSDHCVRRASWREAEALLGIGVDCMHKCTYTEAGCDLVGPGKGAGQSAEAWGGLY